MSFDSLLPETIFKALMAQGYRPTGQINALNSFENRVYDVGLEGHPSVIVKFYRPHRWSEKTLAAEHSFVARLKEEEIPVIAPLPLSKVETCYPTLGLFEGYYFSIYPRARGRIKDEISLDDRFRLGQILARVHNIGALETKAARPDLIPNEKESKKWRETITSLPFVPPFLKDKIDAALEKSLAQIREKLADEKEKILLHGDCHLGNILWQDVDPTLTDFDDCKLGPAVQDAWMLFHGSPEEQMRQRDRFIDGYEIFRSFNHGSLKKSEALRTLRIIHHVFWLASRYTEALFERTFPYYREEGYWSRLLVDLSEQGEKMRG